MRVSMWTASQDPRRAGGHGCRNLLGSMESSDPEVLKMGDSAPRWYLRTGVTVTTGVLLAWSGWKSETLLSALQVQRTTWPCGYNVQRVPG
jgi:hypothetical protein